MSIVSSTRAYPHSGSDAKAKTLSFYAAPKFYLMAGREYLHWSGTKRTTVRAEAWTGTERQGLNCITKFPAAKGCALLAVGITDP